MFYYGHRWRYNSQIGTCCRDDSEGEGCPLPSSSARSLQESLRPRMQETLNGQEGWGAGACPVSLLHCGPAGLPLSAKGGGGGGGVNSTAAMVPCHVTTFVFGSHKSLPVRRD